MKSFLKITLALLFSSSVFGQKNLKTISFKKGEVIDVMLISTQPDSKERYERYGKTAFPIAAEYSYKQQPGFTIKKRIFGSSSPELFIFGHWESLKEREGFLSNITPRLPDFHQQRNELFSHFNLTYFEMSQDNSFTINTEKTNVVTSFWKDTDVSFLAFVSTWKQEVKNYGGAVVVKLSNGTSPLGYAYNPDTLIITQWETQSALDTFIEAHPLAYYNDLENVEQFVIN